MQTITVSDRDADVAGLSVTDLRYAANMSKRSAASWPNGR
jgi:hypothetical protein